MNNRTLVFMTVLVLTGMGVLLGLNLASLMKGKPISQVYLQNNDVRGMAIRHNQLLYTLNFNQQNELIQMINQSDKIINIPEGNRQKPDVESIIVYQFGGAKDLEITPLTYVNNNLVFSVPQWNPEGYLMDVSEGNLKRLLSQTYDP